MSTEPVQADTAQPEYGGMSDWEHDHSLNIAQTEVELRAALADAETALGKVGRLLHDLTDGPAWYVEYAEGIDGRDAVHETEQAKRSVRHVGRIVRHLSPEGGR